MFLLNVMETKGSPLPLQALKRRGVDGISNNTFETLQKRFTISSNYVTRHNLESTSFRNSSSFFF